MIAKEITFINPVPVLGTYVRESYFSAAAGWIIDVHDYGVTLSKPESQNVAEVPAFCICGVGYSVPQPAAATSVGLIGSTGGVISEGALGNTEHTGESLMAQGVAASIALGTPPSALSYAEVAAKQSKGRK